MGGLEAGLTAEVVVVVIGCSVGRWVGFLVRVIGQVRNAKAAQGPGQAKITIHGDRLFEEVMNGEGQDADGACDFGRKSSAVHGMMEIVRCLAAWWIEQDVVESMGRLRALKLGAEDCLGCGRA